MRKVKLMDRPYHIVLYRGDRNLRDSAISLESAKGRIANRKRRRCGDDYAEVLFRGQLVFTNRNENSQGEHDAHHRQRN